MDFEDNFDLTKYFELLGTNIQNILSRPEKDILTYDILDTDISKKNKLIALKEKQRQMKIGEIWQETLGNYEGYTNLKIGHSTGLDILSNKYKIAIELKNRTNTDNASSKKSNFDKLANFKKNNPEYTCIYANINDINETKTLNGTIKKIIHNDIEILHYIGFEFIKFILKDNTDSIIQFIKTKLDQHYL